MNLENIIDNIATDKNTSHSYLPVYQSLFKDVDWNKVEKVLEVGIGHGGSAKLWKDAFPHAEIHVIDIDFSWGLRCDISSPRIKVHIRDAYEKSFVESLGYGTFDVVIDDGPHTLNSMIFFAQEYSKLLKPGGILVIEDVPEPGWIPSITNALPASFKKGYVDNREIKGRFDDILVLGWAP